MLILQEIDNPPITEDERIKLCQKFDCKVELFHSNVCNGVEKSWPKKYFDVDDFKSLSKRKQKQLHHTMTVHAVELYNKYVDPERTKRHMKRKKAEVLAPYWEERRLRHRFERIKKIGENEMDSIDQSILEEANDRSMDEGPRSDNQKKKVGPRSKRPKQSANTSQHENDINLENVATRPTPNDLIDNDEGPRFDDNQNKVTSPRSKRTNRSADTSGHENNTNLENVATPNRRNTRSAQASTSNQKEVSLVSETTTPDRRPTRSTHNKSNVMENENEPEIVPTTPTRRSTNVTPHRPLTRSTTKNDTINTNVTLRRHQEMNRLNDTSDGEVSNHVSPRRRQIPNANVSADNQQSPREDVNTEQIVTTPSRRSNRLSKNISPDAETTPTKSKYRRSNKRRTFDSFSSNEANQTVVYTQSTQSKQSTNSDDSSINVDTPSIGSFQSYTESLSQNVVGTPTVNRQASDHIVTNKTPELIIDENVRDQPHRKRTRRFDNNTTGEINSEDFDQLSGNQTSTQKE